MPESRDFLWTEFDLACMTEALRLADEARKCGEVPVGAVLALHGRIIASAANEIERRGSALAHAECLAIDRASALIGRHGFGGTTLYVTLEPCVMCAGALVAARVETLVFGTRDERFGGCRSMYRITSDPRANHRLIVKEGLLAEACSDRLIDFFRERRLQNRSESV